MLLEGWCWHASVDRYVQESVGLSELWFRSASTWMLFPSSVLRMAYQLSQRPTFSRNLFAIGGSTYDSLAPSLVLQVVATFPRFVPLSVANVSVDAEFWESFSVSPRRHILLVSCCWRILRKLGALLST